MELTPIIHQYYQVFTNKYGGSILPGQLKTMNNICRCRTPDSGELYVQCPDCHYAEWRSLSRGNRNCPKCQNHEASHQKIVFSLFSLCVSSTLKDFGLNPKNLGAEIAMTMVLHTHSRRLDFHPHIHVVVPGGGIDKRRRQWKKKKGKYLFNEFALAKVFRARFFAALNEADLSIPKNVP